MSVLDEVAESEWCRTRERGLRRGGQDFILQPARPLLLTPTRIEDRPLSLSLTTTIMFGSHWPGVWLLLVLMQKVLTSLTILGAALGEVQSSNSRPKVVRSVGARRLNEWFAAQPEWPAGAYAGRLLKN